MRKAVGFLLVVWELRVQRHGHIVLLFFIALLRLGFRVFFLDMISDDSLEGAD